MGFYLISDKSVVVHWAHHEHTRNTDLRPLPANPTPPPSLTLFCSVDVGHDYYQRQSRNRLSLSHKLALGFFCSSTQTSPEEWSAEMRDCRGYNEAFNLAAELTLHSLKSLSAKLSQATWHQDGRTSGGGGCRRKSQEGRCRHTRCERLAIAREMAAPERSVAIATFGNNKHCILLLFLLLLYHHQLAFFLPP